MLIAGCLTLASAGCFHFGAKPISANQLRLNNSCRPTPTSRLPFEPTRAFQTDDLQEHCDQLVAATPGVEELRINQGAIESRQWTLLGNGSDHRWVFVRAPDSSSGGWAPKPGLDKLNFQPPLEPALTPGSSHFLSYAPVQTDSLDESQKSDTIRQVFGTAQGEFTWRGRAYSYTLTPELPCFPQLQ